ncbi:MAG TPA: polyphosphate polymerase domain-containing protein, partial [Lysobacter sp.]
GAHAPSTTRTPAQAATGWLEAPFAPVSLAQLEARASMLERRDNKYVVRAPVLQAALPALAAHFDILEIDGRRGFTYDTCYFDDALMSSYFDHHRGRRKRCKVRIRRYVESNLCFVEVKLKDRRGITVKRRRAHCPSRHRVLDEAAVAHVRDAWRDLYGSEYRAVLAPVLEMRYRRVTLVARDGGERMTIDSGLVFHDADGRREIDGDVFIVETKSANGNGIADKVLRALHQHPTRHCSKYCAAAAGLGLAARHNAFKVALRRLGVAPLPPRARSH